MTGKKRGFIGIQLDGKSIDGRDEGEFLDELQNLVALNTVMLFHDFRVRRGENHHGGTPFRQPVTGLDAKGRDLLDRLHDAGAGRGVSLVLGSGEDRWGIHPDYPGYSSIAMVDCYGRVNRLSCVNNPVWRTFQLACIEDLVRQHPYLAGIMFMHERFGPFCMVSNSPEWQGHPKPGCFCEHCVRKGRERGIDSEKAKLGYQALDRLFHSGGERPTDGWFMSFWRILSRYPEILAWDQFQWDSLHDFRAAMAGAVRAVDSKMEVGFHFQHATCLGQPFWRAMDDPPRIIQYADWVKPSVYPGCSGGRYRNSVNYLHDTILADLPRQTVHDFISGVFLRGAEMGADAVNRDASEQSAFPPEWVRMEVERLVKGCAPKPLYAGLGIGVPGGEKTETPDLVRQWTEACFDGGAHGILLSRHYSEMSKELLKAAGEVIKARMPEK